MTIIGNFFFKILILIHITACSYLLNNVTIRNVQTCREFLWVYLNQTVEDCQEAKSQWIEKMLRKVAVLWLILYIRVTGGDIGRVAWSPLEVGVGGGREQSWAISEMEKEWNESHVLLRWWVYDSQQFTSTACGGGVGGTRQQWGACGVWSGGWALRGLGKGLLWHDKDILSLMQKDNRHAYLR